MKPQIMWGGMPIYGNVMSVVLLMCCLTVKTLSIKPDASFALTFKLSDV